MKRFWRGERKHIDQAKVDFSNRRKRELRDFIEDGNVEGYVEYIKKYDPDITDERLQGFIELFHSERGRHPNDV